MKEGQKWNRRKAIAQRLHGRRVMNTGMAEYNEGVDHYILHRAGKPFQEYCMGFEA
jgi:hypothetical protein